MSLVNYVLIGVLGAILGIALYTAKWDMSRGSQLDHRSTGHFAG